MPEQEEQQQQQREKLSQVIRQWNNNRLGLFEISQPDANLVFHGVMRFYFEDQVGGNVATKCLRFSSSAPAREVIETLSEKFRPDMKMLTDRYSLYEIHSDRERKLDPDERPLVVQLKWNSDNREGRFVLKKDKEGPPESRHEKEKGGVIQSFRRTLSRKEKREKNSSRAAEEAAGEADGSDEKPAGSSNNISGPDWRSGESRTPDARQQQRQVHPEPSGLPLGIKFSDSTEDAFLSAVINYTNSSTVHFKLSPAFVLYAAGRFALRRPGATRGVTSIAGKMVAMTRKVIQRQQSSAGALAFWMANSSELLNFLKRDRDLGRLTQKSQQDLAHLVHQAYSCLIQCLQSELRKHLPTFLIDPEQHGPLPAGIEMVLNTLMNAMALLRRCQVNPALTIQLFSQLFHFVSAWLFNRLVSPDAGAPGLRSHYWGAALRQRLSTIEAWAERQGLELAADCHLGHIVQATALLTMSKYSLLDAEDIQSACFKLNSLQLQTLLAGYFYASDEPRIPPDLIDAAVAAARASADNLIRSEGQDVRREEGLDLHLPFLLPEGGYACESVRGIPAGFREFLEPICRRGLCSLTLQPNPRGDWTAFFDEPTSCAGGAHVAAEPEIVTIRLEKPAGGGMGVSIVAAKGAGQDNLGIYVKSIVKGGPAEMDGGLTAGDQLLSVDGQSLVGLSQERAAAIVMQTGPVVTLQVAKFGASYHGLAALLSEDRTAEDSSRDRRGSEEPESERRTAGLTMMTKTGSRGFYRSSPDVAAESAREDAGGRAHVPKSNMAAVSALDLRTDTFHREYLTLPNPKSRDKGIFAPRQLQQAFQVSLRPLEGQSSVSKSAFMRQALSQENLCVDDGGPLLDGGQNARQGQGAGHAPGRYSQSTLRPSVSAHDILSENCSPAGRQQGQRAGVWRTPFSQQPTPAPSVQPLRIDIPVTRAVGAQAKPPPLLTFARSSSTLPAKMSQTLEANASQGRKQSPQMCVSYAASKRTPPASLLSPGAHADQAAKPHVVISPTKHVSFQDPPARRRPGAAAALGQRGPPVPADPWRREAQERLEKQQRLQVVELLEREVQELQAKAERTAEEDGRLRKLSLEWQFQKRLREIQQRGEDDDDDDDEEDLDMMMVIQQLERRVQNKRSCEGKVNGEAEERTGSPASRKEEEAKTVVLADHRPGGLIRDNMTLKQHQQGGSERPPAPERLPFKERQRLFSLATSA